MLRIMVLVALVALRSVLFDVRTKYLNVVQGISRQLTVWYVIKHWNVILGGALFFYASSFTRFLEYSIR